nr:reverse transcriptase domain-containing protein [Tanacetum cinerariifolium]
MIISQVKSSDANSSCSSEIAKLTHAVNQQTSAVTTAMTAILKQFQATPPPAFVKAVEEICVTYGGAHPYYQCLVANGNTFPELRDNIQGYVAAATVNYNQAITTQSGIVLDGPSVPIPPLFTNPKEDERVEETLTDQDLAEYTIKLHINITLADALILIPKYQKMLKALLSNMEKLLELANTPLNENCSAVILNKLHEKLGDLGKFLILCGFSELKCKALTDLGASINLMPLSVWKKIGLPELISTRMTLELANRVICTPAGIAIDVFVPVGKFTFPADFVIVDNESDPRVPLILGRPFLRTAHALIDVHGEEMILHDDLIATNHLSGNPTCSSHLDLTSPEVKDDIFDPEGGNVLIEKDMDSILKDSIDENNLADLNDNLIDTMPKMFTDEHALDYLSPSMYDKYDDDIFELDSDNDDAYNDPFDSKGEKIKESKLLIDELDLPRSSDFLPSPKYDSFLFEDFSEVDALPSTNNEDKMFNPEILIHENLVEVNTQVAPDKNVKKIAIYHASFILEDFDPPPLYELPFLKEVPRSKTLLLFSSKNEDKIFKPGFSLLKEFILLFSRNHLIGAPKLSKSLKLLKA